MTDAFTVDAARALGGPDWLVQRRRRRGRAARRRSRGRRRARRSGATAGSTSSTSTRYRPFAAEELGAPGDERAPGGGPWAAEAGAHAAMIVVRDGRVVHHELDPALEAKGVRVVRHRDVRRRARRELARRARRRDVRRRVHRAARRVPRRRRVRPRARRRRGRGSDPRAALVRGRRRARRSRTRSSSLGERAEATVLDRFGSPDDRSPRRRGHRAARRRQRAPALPRRCRSTARARGTSVSSARDVGRDATVRIVGGRARRRLRAAAQRGAARRARAPRATSSRCTSATARRCSTSARSRTTTRRGRAATCCSRARSRTTPARCTPASCACGRPRRRRTRTQTNRNLVLTEGASAESIPNLEIEANDVRCSHASTVGPIDDDQLYYLEIARHPAGRGRAADRARVLRRRVRRGSRQRADAPACGARSSRSSSTAGTRRWVRRVRVCCA